MPPKLLHHRTPAAKHHMETVSRSFRTNGDPLEPNRCENTGLYHGRRFGYSKYDLVNNFSILLYLSTHSHLRLSSLVSDLLGLHNSVAHFTGRQPILRHKPWLPKSTELSRHIGNFAKPFLALQMEEDPAFFKNLP